MESDDPPEKRLPFQEETILRPAVPIQIKFTERQWYSKFGELKNKAYIHLIHTELSVKFTTLNFLHISCIVTTFNIQWL